MTRSFGISRTWVWDGLARNEPNLALYVCCIPIIWYFSNAHTLQSQADYHRQFLQQRRQLLDRFISAFACQSHCSHCGERKPVWRCLDCLSRPQFCEECCRSNHQWNPFHRVQKWFDKEEEKYWEDGWLRDAGVTIRLAHPLKKCENGQEEANAVTIVDQSGIHKEMAVYYCQCPNAPSKPDQLFDAGLFAASFDTPATAFTFQVLDACLLENLECHTSATKFHSKLQRITNWHMPHRTKVSRSRALSEAARSNTRSGRSARAGSGCSMDV